MCLKIATFNLKHDCVPFLPTNWCNRKDAVKAFFEKETPDIVGTQELTKRTLSDMEKMLPGYAFIGEGRGGGDLGEYSAIFYLRDRIKCLDSGTFWLARQENVPNKRDWLALFPRICTWGLFQNEAGQQLRVYNTHLDHVSPLARKRGLALIGAHVQRDCKGVAAVLTGDFNATPKSGAMKTLKALNIRYGLFTAGSYKVFVNAQSGIEPVGNTYHGFSGKTGGSPLDYIFTSKEISILDTQIKHEKYAGQYPSDHFPILMKIKIEM